MVRLRTILLITGVVLLSTNAPLVNADGLDHCNDVLVHDIANKQVISTSRDSALAKQQARCAINASSSSRSGNTSLGGGYGPISANGSQSNSYSDSSESSDCGSAKSAEHASAALYYAQSSYQDVVRAWQTCITNVRTFSCSITRQVDGRHLVVDANWDIQSALPRVVSSNVQIGRRPPREAFPKGKQLLAGDNQLYIDRNDDEAVSVSMALTGDGYNAHSCSVMVPSVDFEAAVPRPVPTPEPQPPTSSTCTQFREGRVDEVACNTNTAKGFYWKVGKKIAHYSVSGVTTNGQEPTCDQSTVNSTAMTSRFPATQPTFQPVSTSITNVSDQMTAPGCNYVGPGHQVTTQDIGLICGIFEAICLKQPSN